MKFLLPILFSLALLPSVAMAQVNVFQELDKTGGEVYGSAEAPQGDVYYIIGTILNVALSMLGILFFGLMVYAGFLWMTAGGETTQVTKASSTLRNAVIGLILVLAAFAVVNYFMVRLANILSAGG